MSTRERTQIKRGCASNLAQSFDIFGQGVALTFRKKPQFSTPIGTFFSVQSMVLIISFTVNRTTKLVSKGDPFFSMLMMASEDEEFDLWELDYMFAVEAIDPRVGQVFVNQVIWGAGLDIVTEEIKMVNCNELLPGGSHEGKSNNASFDIEKLTQLRKNTFGFLCPVDAKRMSVVGNFGAPNFDYVHIGLKGCDLGDDCFSDDQLTSQSINYVTLRSNPSLLGSETESYISYSQDYTFFKTIIPQFTQSINIFFMKSTITLKDNIIDIFDQYETENPIFEESQKTELLSVLPQDLPRAEKEYVSIYLRADSEKRIYKREGYDILTFLGDIGGLFDIILTLGYLMTSLFVGQLFSAALIQEAYKIQTYFRDDSQFYELKQTGKLSTESDSVSSGTGDSLQSSVYQSTSQHHRQPSPLRKRTESRAVELEETKERLDSDTIMNINASRVADLDLIAGNETIEDKDAKTIESQKTIIDRIKQFRNFLISARPKRQHLYCIYHLIVNQLHFKYGIRDQLKAYVRCFVCRKSQSLKNLKSARNEFYLSQGLKKLERDLDIVNLMNLIKGYRVMRKVLFNHDQRFLMKFQKMDVLNSDQEETDQSSSQDVEILFDEQVDSEDQAKREKVKQEVAEKLRKYQDKRVSKKDFRILQGVLSTNFGQKELVLNEQQSVKQVKKTASMQRRLTRIASLNVVNSLAQILPEQAAESNQLEQSAESSSLSQSLGLALKRLGTLNLGSREPAVITEDLDGENHRSELPIPSPHRIASPEHYASYRSEVVQGNSEHEVTQREEEEVAVEANEWQHQFSAKRNFQNLSGGSQARNHRQQFHQLAFNSTSKQSRRESQMSLNDNRRYLSVPSNRPKW